MSTTLLRHGNFRYLNRALELPCFWSNVPSLFYLNRLWIRSNLGVNGTAFTRSLAFSRMSCPIFADQANFSLCTLNLISFIYIESPEKANSFNIYIIVKTGFLKVSVALGTSFCFVTVRYTNYLIWTQELIFKKFIK